MGITDPGQRVTALKGVGPGLAAMLARLGIERVFDLLLHLPLRYQDRTRVVPLRDVVPEQECLVRGQIVDCRISFGRRRSLQVTLDDGTGFLNIRFFHFSAAQQAGLRPGLFAECFGQARFGRDGLEMVHPEYRASIEEAAGPEPRLTPVYPVTKGLGQARLRNLTAQALASAASAAGAGAESPTGAKSPASTDTFERVRPVGEESPYAALAFLHRPPPTATPEALESARARIALDELTAYYLVMRRRQALRQQQPAVPLPPTTHLGRRLLRALDFELTGAQKRVVREVLEDLARPKPMWRLLQGDVGSGKTVIAAFAAVRASEHGLQTALMAPTEILAEQHFLTLTEWLAPLGIEVALITGSQNARTRAATRAAIAAGRALVAVGTHALFQDEVEFRDLVLTIVDEQHRFGVHQRMALRSKGRTPHQLVMTATPIPRTLTMALYADMDVSTLDELPKGRQPIETRVLPDTRRSEVIERVARRLARGEQAYWICPLIEDSEQLPAVSVEALTEMLASALPGVPVGGLHGRMKGDQKAEIMTAFKSGALRVLVATTVVEVGVDVPDATLMVIENPERLGLSQLHQLRGRVGRGTRQSHCVLLYHGPLSAVSRSRLEVIRDSQDGFYIAEQDLRLRGPGDLLGTRQTGEQQFRVADLRAHAHLISQVVERGDRLIAEDPAAVARLLNFWAPEDSGTSSV